MLIRHPGDWPECLACHESTGARVLPDADNCLAGRSLDAQTRSMSLIVIDRSRRDSNPRCLSTQRFSRPSPENGKGQSHKDLREAQSGAYKQAYKENPKTAENDASELPSDLGEIVTVWPKLPEHIKAAVMALVQTHKQMQ